MAGERQTGPDAETVDVADLLRFFEKAGMLLTMREVRHAVDVLAGRVAGPEFGPDAETPRADR